MTQIIHNNAASYKMMIANPEQDFIRVKCSGDMAEHNCIIDPANNALMNEAHRDGVQLLPDDQGKRYQYGLAEICDATIRNNFIDSGNSLQGVFMSDGLASNLHICNNRIQTNGQHYISINGMLSGYIHNNRNAKGELCPVKLGPARIGGRPKGGISVYVIGFADRKISPVDHIVPQCDGFDHVTDERLGHTKPRAGDMYLYDFRLADYWQARNKLSEKSVLTPAQFQELAMDYGSEMYFT